MPAGAPGAEQFANMILRFRNESIIAAMQPLIVFRTELCQNTIMDVRTGMPDVTRDFFKEKLFNADRRRRAITYVTEPESLPALLQEASDIRGTATIGENPFTTDSIQLGSSELVTVPWPFDGTDPNIPLLSQLTHSVIHSGDGVSLLGALDNALVAWTRLESRKLSNFITQSDSMRMYTHYQRILGYLEMFGGDDNMIDVSQVLPTEEPRGPGEAPNLATETNKGAVSSAPPTPR